MKNNSYNKEIKDLKQRCSYLEMQTFKLNKIIDTLGVAINNTDHVSYTCGVCGISVDTMSEGSCQDNACPHGMN